MIFDLRWKQNLGLVVLKSKDLKISFMAGLNDCGQPTGKRTWQGLKLMNLAHPEQLGVSGPLALQPKALCHKNRMAEQVQRPDKTLTSFINKDTETPRPRSKTQSPVFVVLPLSEGQPGLTTRAHNGFPKPCCFWPRAWVSSEPPVHPIAITSVIISLTGHRCK